jgi:hypothetical protein
MAPNFLTQANWALDDTPSAAQDRQVTSLLEAERALQELADVFLQQQSLISSTSLDFAKTAESKPAPEAPLLNMEAEIPGAC